MTFRHLKIFIAVAQTGSMSASCPGAVHCPAHREPGDR